MRHIKIVQTILFAGIALVTFCTSALADMDWKRMKRDLSIQESILDQFFEEKKVSTTGLYIENHGISLIASGGVEKYEIRVHAIGDKNVNIVAIPDKNVVRIQKTKRDKSNENEEEEILEFSMTGKTPEASQNEKKRTK
ncbi:MAG: hypothetical protein F4Y79_09360 [Gemmatimonadetes bacterium]|nr:hypothetical protein [Gemmatimonadota bacterium]